MSDTYRMTDVMALPDDPLVDYTIKTAIWDRLQLPLTPKKIASAVLGSGDLGGLPLPELDQEEEEDAAAAAAAAAQRAMDSAPPDWSTFDFASMDALPETFDDVDDPDGERKLLGSATATRTATLEPPSTGEIDVDKFFDNIADGTALDLLDGVSSATSARAKTAEELEDEYDFQDDYTEAIEQNLTPQMRASKLQNSTRAVVCKNFRTPAEWLTKPEFADHVGFEQWSNYSPEMFDDSLWQWEDLATVLSTEHLLKITDLYLQDHRELKHKADMRKYWTRLLEAKLSGQNVTKEPIPIYLTPDLDRGVTYSDEIIEMKSKLVLQTYQPPPHVMFANDSFTPNEELETLNRIGTIRNQYDWSPSVSPEDCEIDEAIVAKIGPVLRFVNHAAELKSTKVK